MAIRACRDLLDKFLIWASTSGESGDEIGLDAGETRDGDGHDGSRRVANRGERSSLLGSNGPSHDIRYMGCVNIKSIL